MIVVTLAGIELRYLVNQISDATQDYYVSNIYGVTKDSILFKLHHVEPARPRSGGPGAGARGPPNVTMIPSRGARVIVRARHS